MFIKNKYYIWYSSIVERAKARKLVGYTEKHHIIPQSLGGSNSKINLVNLSAREHFICHWLLTKCVLTNVEKMKYALWLMMNVQNKHQTHRYKVNSRTYHRLKEELLTTFSNQHKGRVMSEETKKKISETRKRKIAEGSLKVNENKEKYKIIAQNKIGKKLSDETKNKISNGNKGKVRSEEHKKVLSDLYKGSTRSSDIGKKISDSMKKQYATGARIPYNKRNITNE